MFIFINVRVKKQREFCKIKMKNKSLNYWNKTKMMENMNKSKRTNEENNLNTQNLETESHSSETNHPEEETFAEQDTTESYETLKQQYDELLAQVEEQKEDYIRKMAEFENSRKRLAKEKEDVVKFANEKLVEELFPILDNLEMTLSHAQDKQDDPLVSGVELILKQFHQTLEKYGLQAVEGLGEPFDPNLQEAIGTEESGEHASGIVTQVHRKGYKLKDRLIRAALVTVSQ